MTVLTEREFGIAPTAEAIAPEEASRPAAIAVAEPAEEAPAAKPKRTRKAKTEDKS